MSEENKRLILISGESTTGKSASLRNLRQHEKWIYLNCESGKDLPFRNKFEKYTIIDPYQVVEAVNYLNASKDHVGGIVDTLTYLLDMYESIYVYESANGQQAWMNFQQFFKNLLQSLVAGSDKTFIFLAHTSSYYDETILGMRASVPVKGALKTNGIESYFSTVVSTKKVPLKTLKDYENSLLNITPDDELLGYKHVFQTRLTKETSGERIRSPMDMFTIKETFIDNDAQLLLDHINKYYS